MNAPIQKNIKVEIYGDVNEAEWNNFLMGLNAGYFNSMEFAEINRSINNIQPFFISYFRDNIKVGQLLLLKSYPDPRMLQSYSPFPKITGWIYRNFFKRAVWNYGPVFIESMSQDEVSDFIKMTIEFIENQKFNLVTCALDTSLEIENDEVFQIWGTFIIKLYKYDTIDDYLRELPSNTRYQIKRAQRDGIQVKVLSSQKEIKEYINEWKKTWIHKKGLKPQNSYLLKYFNKHKELASENYDYCMLGAYYENKLIGGVSIPIFKKWACIEAFFTSDFAREKHLFAGDALIWTALMECKAKGVEYFDLIGFNPSENRSPKENGIYFFKKRWSGDIKLYSQIRKQKPNHVLKCFSDIEKED